MLEALGMIEVTGYLGAISAADAALKAANVKLLKSEKVKGGITTIELIGDVAAITAAVDAGKVVAENLGCFRASHVIPRMDPATQSLLLDELTVKEGTAPENKVTEEQLVSQVEELKVEIFEEEIVADATLKDAKRDNKKVNKSTNKKSAKKDKK
ncbi:hypothetical protein A5821_000993 [Enterococcus sp. 7F3_DIV0205]|uniref:BMC domain-containing protein n=1 Tax=Candidatus Enterococcus palustris TaxID=1834189 RepID=A0AAQ3W824_9ENTE|nr:BMC domain-containing protein [Enterococcus sp. 7F3_DIV0205]OTN85390.1 hypothetical protein A5821_001336 [Enterococcus sp. 7F3_DIV0205]